MERTKIILPSQFSYFNEVLKNQVNARYMICHSIKKNLRAASISDLLTQIELDVIPSKAKNDKI